MTTPATPDTPAAAPLDAERARLRSAGYTDAEISHILTQREIGASPQQSAGAGQGVMSNVLSSIVAVASHARALIPAYKQNVATVFDGGATGSARAAAAALVAGKTVVILVLGYAAWQEWQIHINYASQTAYGQATQLNANPNLTAADFERAAKRKAAADAKQAQLAADIDWLFANAQRFEAACASPTLEPWNENPESKVNPSWYKKKWCDEIHAELQQFAASNPNPKDAFGAPLLPDGSVPPLSSEVAPDNHSFLHYVRDHPWRIEGYLIAISLACFALGFLMLRLTARYRRTHATTARRE
jgi:hypothetical protein